MLYANLALSLEHELVIPSKMDMLELYHVMKQQVPAEKELRIA